LRRGSIPELAATMDVCKSCTLGGSPRIVNPPIRARQRNNSLDLLLPVEVVNDMSLEYATTLVPSSQLPSITIEVARELNPNSLPI
jgi:hypothetical protein